ncbi:MAG: 7-cyano-7-deazaguanine synthase QueC [Paludibacterium sp.]|uniref:7-cyano-7-deazaguanine synthase QueC n=1 Tax=Paludibacterium sp. TaxID=1917523 RepID=UPI0025F3606E|nr:7-cyano-7-deazaguanine synthase QueC [Paludibacterium sp.]MBV8046380.1 7-cyano-7-deazaguanine synthase QueC [Paludibacterium sp.]MBV8648502.1 7-cyano-7-deazaguanine synthase QueC [Paludibacterium sp.]
MEQHTDKALVVLSGGQDSTTCLFWAIRRFGQANVSAVTFDYGQRHRIELEAASTVAKLAGVAQTVLPIDTFAAIGGNALTDASLTPQTGEAHTDALPNTFVPGRNLIFLTFAAALAYTRGIGHIVTGVAQTDYSGYPDCRENTLKALELAIRLGMDAPRLTLHAPLMYMTKAETVHLAEEVGAMAAMAWSHTCYNGAVPPCGECDSCRLRARGFAEAGVADPLIERTARS